MNTERQRSEELQALLDAIQQSKVVLDNCSEERQQKYQDAVRSYLSYLRKETRMLETNIRHSDVRNSQFLDEVRKAQVRGTANSKRLITMMERTNQEKESLQRYIDRLEDHRPLDRSQEFSHLQEDRAADLEKYRDILAEFQHRLG